MVAMMKDKIRSLRKAKGLSLQKFGDVVGCSKGYMCDLEHGTSPRPSAYLLSKIADALGVSIDFLLDDSIETPTQKTLATNMVRKINRLCERDQMMVMEIIELFLCHKKRIDL